MIDAREYLLQIPMFANKKNTLSDLKDWITRLGIYEEKMKIIHVAGTNGKGSVCALMTSVLMAGGYHTGTFISPHLTDIRERFLIDGQMVGETLFQSAFEKVYDLNKRMTAESYCHLTFFEFVFLMGLWIFTVQKVDVVVLETGMGGRLDATNVFAAPLQTVITSISHDHTQFLGDTLPEIADEKGGIIKSHVPLAFLAGDPAVNEVLIKQAEQMSAPYVLVGQDQFQVISRGRNHIYARFRRQNGQTVEINVPFAAGYQLQNVALTIAAFDQMNLLAVTNDSLKRGIETARWSGRMEEFRPGIYLDGAHNTGGIEAFTAAVKELTELTGCRPVLLFAVLQDKDYTTMISQLCSQIEWKAIIVGHAGNKRGLSEDQTAALFRQQVKCEVQQCADIETAVRYATTKKKPDEILFCTGSLYLIGEIQTVLRRKADA